MTRPQQAAGAAFQAGSVAAAIAPTRRGRVRILAPIAAVVVVAAIVIAGFATGWFGLGGPAVRASTNDYSWDELSKISEKISASGSEEAALKVAEKYHLVGSDGKLDGSQAKEFQLADGTAVKAQIAGFYHDDKTGGGKAGITFITSGAVAEHAMNASSSSSSRSNAGGWEASKMRSWLSGTMASQLPAEITSRTVAVDKRTNNVGKTTDASSVTTTSDKLWLFSTAELCGDISWGWDDSYNNVMNAEGEQYQLFSDCGVTDANQGNSILTKSMLASGGKNWDKGGACLWWCRSAYPSGSDTFNDVYSDGSPYYGYGAGFSYGVVLGFCI